MGVDSSGKGTLQQCGELWFEFGPKNKPTSNKITSDNRA